jgi:transketolase
MDAVSRRNSFDSAAARRRCKSYRKRILDISQQVGALHIAPAFSCLETVDVIYHGLIRRGASKALLDTFLMSKGHGCMSQYVILEEFGILTAADLATYCKPDGRLGAHPDYGTPGIAASTGSLGHGLGIACGMAYADKLQHDDRHTYVVLSDGECQEGSTWEAMMMSANLKLDNLTAFLDLNDFSGMDRMSVTHPAFYPVADKVRAFGWEVHEVNGHDASAVFEAATSSKPGKPLMVVCKTVKGRGVSYMEHVPIWHYRSPNKQEYEQALHELAEIAS